MKKYNSQANDTKKAGHLARFFCVIFFCGERGIRTPGTVTSTTVFETVPFDHSGISPDHIPIVSATKIRKLSYSPVKLIRFFISPVDARGTS